MDTQKDKATARLSMTCNDCGHKISQDTWELFDGFCRVCDIKKTAKELKASNDALLEALKNYTLCGTALEVKPMRQCLVDAMSLITKIEIFDNQAK